MMVPCKDCLILPICKNKPVITCKLLFDYRWEQQRECLIELETYIPNWRTKIILRANTITYNPRRNY